MCEENEVGAQVAGLLGIVSNSEHIDIPCAQGHLKALRILATKGPNYQLQIACHDEFNRFLSQLLTSAQLTELKYLALQVLHNAMVQNEKAQCLMWARHGSHLLEGVAQPPLGNCTEVKLSCLCNIHQNPARLLTDEQLLGAAVRVWKAIVDLKCYGKFDFLHICFERFLVRQGRIAVRCYAHMGAESRLSLLDYLTHYVRQDSPNGPVQPFLLDYLAKEFKMKSDSILRTVKQAGGDLSQPREVYALLRVIACGSGSELYAAFYAKDHALFLNVSSLLRALIAVGKEATPNMFTPKTKLEEVTPTSSQSKVFEAELSYELKTLLMRCVANLLYKNKVNQGYCLDTQLLPALLESTIIDGRNPLLKEWSILAIRNACYECPEIQSVIANVSKEGEADNNLLTELNLEMGSLRIKPSEEGI